MSETNDIRSRMNMNEFKRSYTEINPNANIQNLDNDAERKCRELRATRSVERIFL